MNINESIKEELLSHIADLKSEEILTEENKDDWHHIAFNETCYIIYCSAAIGWLDRHNLTPFEAIGEIAEYEQLNFGKVYTDFSSPEAVVNMYVYICGEELLN